MKRILITSLILFISLFNFVSQAEENNKMNIYIENRSSFNKFVQIRDNICDKVPKGCEINIGWSKWCEKKEANPQDNTLEITSKKICIEAKNKLQSFSCLKGIIYEDWINSWDKIQLSICRNDSAYGKISIRSTINKDEIEKKVWSHKHLLNGGDIIDPQ